MTEFSAQQRPEDEAETELWEEQKQEADHTPLFTGEIIEACFDPEDMPDSITVTIRCARDTRVGHWFVNVMQAPQ